MHWLRWALEFPPGERRCSISFAERDVTRVLYAALREPTYVRNLVALRALGKSGFAVITATSNGQTYPRRAARVLAKLLRAAVSDEFDVVVVGFLAQPLVPLIRLLTRKPVVVDGFISLYDTLCFDRQSFQPTSLVGRIAWWLDRAAFRLADVLIADTDEHAEYFRSEFGIPRSKVRVIAVGADDEVFYPRPRRQRARSRIVFYYATGLPVHGVELVIAAARLLEDRGIEFRTAMPSGLVADPPRNLTRLGWVSAEVLAAEMTAADVVLGGHFSTLPKACRVVAGKTYQAIACGRPTIVTDLPANRRAVSDGVTAYFCAADRPESIAEAILRVIANPSKATRVSRQARLKYESTWHADALAPLWAEAIQTAMRARR